MSKRINRVRLQWASRVTSDEYKLLDTILYRTALGESYVLRIKTLCNETNLTEDVIRKIMMKWVFLHEETRERVGKLLVFDYEGCLNFFPVTGSSNSSPLINDYKEKEIKEVQELKEDYKNIQRPYKDVKPLISPISVITPIKPISPIKENQGLPSTMRSTEDKKNLVEVFESFFKTGSASTERF